MESDEEEEEAGDTDVSSEDEKGEESEESDEVMCQPPYIKTVSKFQVLYKHTLYTSGLRGGGGVGVGDLIPSLKSG